MKKEFSAFSHNRKQYEYSDRSRVPAQSRQSMLPDSGMTRVKLQNGQTAVVESRVLQDSGMVSHFSPSQHVKTNKQGFLGRLQARWSKIWDRAPHAQTTEQGSSGFAAPSTAELSLYSLRYLRRSYLDDVNRQYLDDPRCFRSINKFAREAVRGGFTIVVSKNIPEDRRNKAMAIAKDLTPRINKPMQSWAKMTMVEGESFCQAVIYQNQIVGVKRMPTPSMERNSNDSDEFDNPEEAFSQVDVMTNSEVATFPEAIMWHGRWNWIDGQRYGIPELLPSRRARQLLEMVEEAQARRRIARAAMHYLFIIGNKDNPGDYTDIQKFKEVNGMVDGRREALNPIEVGRDYFVNGLGDAKVLEGDAHVHEIADVEYFQELYTAAGLPTPPALIGIGQKGVNRDVLEDQRAEWLKETQVLSDLMAEGVRFFFDLALLLAGIMPEQVDYKVHFSESNIETPSTIVERIIKLRQSFLGTPRNGIPDPLISRITAIQHIAEFVDVEDVEAELEAIEAEMADYNEQLEKQSEAAAGPQPPQLTGGTPEAGNGTPQKGSKGAKSAIAARSARTSVKPSTASTKLPSKAASKNSSDDSVLTIDNFEKRVNMAVEKILKKKAKKGRSYDLGNLPGKLYAGLGSPIAPMNSTYGEAPSGDLPRQMEVPSKNGVH